MAFKRRRKPRVVWLPVHGRDFTDIPEQSYFGNGIGGFSSLNPNGAFYTDIQAVTFDYSDSASNEEGTEFRSLQDLTSGNNYRLRRIVGKFHAAVSVDADAGTVIPLVQVAAGFMVNRTDPDGNALYSFTQAIEQGPLAQDSAEDPWIWRRTWFLSPVPELFRFNTSAVQVIADLDAFSDIFSSQGQFPQTTAGYGSVLDGPHIDQKTARIISNQERLFFWAQARIVNPGATTTSCAIAWNLDLRILASLRSSQGNRRNASR